MRMMFIWHRPPIPDKTTPASQDGGKKAISKATKGKNNHATQNNPEEQQTDCLPDPWVTFIELCLTKSPSSQGCYIEEPTPA
jgi:hypothetical protein